MSKSRAISVSLRFWKVFWIWTPFFLFSLGLWHEKRWVVNWSPRIYCLNTVPSWNSKAFVYSFLLYSCCNDVSLIKSSYTLLIKVPHLSLLEELLTEICFRCARYYAADSPGINSVLVFPYAGSVVSGLSELGQKWQIMPSNSMPLKMSSAIQVKYIIDRF